MSAIDRRHSVLLRDAAATEMKDALGRVAREGMHLGRGISPGDVYELVPPDHLAKGIREGALRSAAPTSGDASVLIKNVDDGRIAGRADLREVKPTPAKMLGPAAWQAMALATQQHYLVQISGTLDDIKAGVHEVLDTMVDDRVGTIAHLSEVAEDTQIAMERDGSLSAQRIDELRSAARRAKELWHQVATTARRQLDQYERGEISPEEVERTFALLVQATHVLIQCSSTLTSTAYRSADDLEDAIEEEQDRLHPALPDFLELCGAVSSASDVWRERHLEYEQQRPKNRVARRLNVPPVQVSRAKGALSVTRHYEPQQQPISDTHSAALHRIAASGESESPALLAEVQPDGSVLTGPVAATD